MEVVPVTWYDQAQRPGPGICDFCSTPMPSLGLVAIVEFVAVGETRTRDLVMPGLWALCNTCRGLVGIQPGDTEVSLEALERRHRQAIIEICIRRKIRLDLVDHLRWFTREARKVPEVEGVEVVPGATFDGRGNFRYDMDKLAEHFGVGLHSEELGQIMVDLEELFGG